METQEVSGVIRKKHLLNFGNKSVTGLKITLRDRQEVLFWLREKTDCRHFHLSCSYSYIHVLHEYFLKLLFNKFVCQIFNYEGFKVWELESGKPAPDSHLPFVISLHLPETQTPHWKGKRSLQWGIQWQTQRCWAVWQVWWTRSSLWRASLMASRKTSNPNPRWRVNPTSPAALCMIMKNCDYFNIHQ